jgi:hypothetical protein
MHKILIAITSCPRYLDRRNACRDSWASWVTKLNPAGVDVRFFTGQEPCPADDLVGDIIHLPCGDSYEGLPKKTQELVKWALAHRYERLIKCDDDTFLSPMPEYLAELTKADCVGSLRVGPSWNSGIAYPQGGAYSLSLKAMRAVISQPQLFTTGIEDGAVGKALHCSGIQLSHCDRIKTDYRHGVPMPSNDIISAHKVTPQLMADIFNINHIAYLSCYNQLLNALGSPYSDSNAPGGTQVPPVTFGTPCFSSGEWVTHSDGITLVVTSCNRHDLLQKTLESISRYVDLPIAQTIIIEDSPAPEPDFLDSITNLGKIHWLSNGRRVGQLMSIDRAYSFVHTPYIFHCEDDWEFTQGGFLKPSLDILKQHPKIISVGGLWDTNGHPSVDDPQYPDFKIQQPCWHDFWGGLSFNPGLRRLSDWKQIGSYGKQVGYNLSGLQHEQKLSKLYLDRGYTIAVLPGAKPYIKHIGYNRSMAIVPIPTMPKVLVAIPACHKYEYAEFENNLRAGKRDTKGRLKALRDTWLKDIKPFSSYVDYKVFFGRPASKTPKPDEVYLDVGDDYKSLSYKLQATCKYALDNGYDFLFKSDDDTWVYFDRLMRSGFECYDQLGWTNCPHRGDKSQCRCFIVGGPGFWLSRKALQMVVNSTIDHYADDLWLGNVLRNQPSILQHSHTGYKSGCASHFMTSPLPSDCITAHSVRAVDMYKIYKETNAQ